MTHRRCIGTVSYLGGIMAVPEPFAWDWSEMREYSREALCQDGEFIRADRARLSLHDHARNELVDRMLGDWLMMYDADVTFAPDTTARLVRLMYAYDLDVVTGLNHYKHGAHYPMIYRWNEANQSHDIIAKWDPAAELVEIDSSGGGCLLIRQRALKQIVQETGENPFTRIMPFGEDHSFYSRLRKVGLKAYCAPRVEVGHLAFAAINSRDRKPSCGDAFTEHEGFAVFPPTAGVIMGAAGAKEQTWQ